MKQIKTLTLAIALFVGALTSSTAQDLVAHIDVQKLVEAMPAMKNAKVELEKIAKSYEAEISAMATELKSKMDLYNAQADQVTQQENDKRVKEVQGMENNIRGYQTNAQKELQAKEFELLKPIMEKGRVAIQKVARAQGFKYVLDSSNGAGLILADGKDLLVEVKKELGF
jgi:outer membrane protein